MEVIPMSNPKPYGLNELREMFLKFFETKNTVTLVVGIVALVTGIGNGIFWIVDLVTEIMHNKITVLAD